MLHLVLVNLLRNPRRVILTTLAIAVSIFVLSILLSVPAIADRILGDRASSLRLICHSKAGMLYSLPEAYRRKIEGRPGVQAVAAFTFFLGIYHEPTDQFPNAAVDHEQLEVIWPDWGITPAAVGEFKRLRIACLAGPALMDRFHWHVAQQITLRGTIYPVNLTFQIVGVLGDKAPPPILLFRRDYLDEATNHQAPVNIYWVKVNAADSIPEVAGDIDQMFANSSAETRTETEFAFFSNVLSNYRIIFAMARVVGLIVAITIALVAANTAAMSIRERQTEIAIMRALGFQASTIISSLVGEGLIMGFTAGVLGCAAAYAALRGLSVGSAALGPLGLALRLPGPVAVETMTAAILIGGGSALIPAMIAARRNIVDAIRNVG
jgi:putative ABC transport system permease protein